jgi:hypothetical protein
MHVMGTKGTLNKDIEETLFQLEQLSDEIRVKMHLANMDAKDMWEKKLEPQLEKARVHAKEASHASKAAIEDSIEAFRRFAASL